MRSLRKSTLELPSASKDLTAGFLPASAAAIVSSLALSITLTTDAFAQQIDPAPVADPAPVLLYETGSFMPRIYGVAQPLAPRWKASYGLGRADETALSSAFLRLDELIDTGELDSRGSQENWRHFLGVEYAPIQGVALLGGIAKAGGSKGASLAPTGYEKIRLNTGARWRGDDWGLDGGFAFIPEGTNRVPSDAGFVPGMGGGGPTWLLSLTVSRRF